MFRFSFEEDEDIKTVQNLVMKTLSQHMGKARQNIMPIVLWMCSVLSGFLSASFLEYRKMLKCYKGKLKSRDLSSLQLLFLLTVCENWICGRFYGEYCLKSGW